MESSHMGVWAQCLLLGGNCFGDVEKGLEGRDGSRKAVRSE